jgi:hypothetical protein
MIERLKRQIGGAHVQTTAGNWIAHRPAHCRAGGTGRSRYVIETFNYWDFWRIRPCHASSTARDGIAQHPSLNGHAMPIKACAL